MIDSASDINQEEANRLGIILMPMEIRFTDEEFLDGVNLYANDFYKKLEICTELPKQVKALHTLKYKRRKK